MWVIIASALGFIRFLFDLLLLLKIRQFYRHLEKILHYNQEFKKDLVKNNENTQKTVTLITM